MGRLMGMQSARLMSLFARWGSTVFNLRGIASLYRLPRYFVDLVALSRASARKVGIIDSYPCLSDAISKTPFDAHYFFQAAWLFWRDAYFPYWTATVNGKDSGIIRAFGAYKAVALPTGESKVSFRFQPTPVAVSLSAAYSAILAVLVFWFVSPLHRPG